MTEDQAEKETEEKPLTHLEKIILMDFSSKKLDAFTDYASKFYTQEKFCHPFMLGLCITLMDDAARALREYENSI